ncbi:hypothetical protein ACLOJK_015067 [Asimina triloba]
MNYYYPDLLFRTIDFAMGFDEAKTNRKHLLLLVGFGSAADDEDDEMGAPVCRCDRSWPTAGQREEPAG